MWFYRGKDDLTKEIDEYYHSKGDYSHDEDSWVLGDEGKAHDKHSLGYEIAESENKKYVDHSKHSFAEEVAESDKSRKRNSGTDLGNMLIDSIEKASQKAKSTPSAQNVFTAQKGVYNYGYNTSRQRRRRSRSTTPFVAVFIMFVFFIIFAAMMITGLGAVREINRPNYSYTAEDEVTNEYFNFDDYDDIRRSYPDYDFSQVDAVADFIDESTIIYDLEQTNALSNIYCEISGEYIFWYFDIFYSGEGTDRERIADAVVGLGNVIKEHDLSNTEINVYVYNDNDTYLFNVDSENQYGFLEVFDRLGEI